MRGTFVCLALSASTLGAATSASAQELQAPEAGQGYYLGGGISAGVSAADADDVGSLGALTHFGFTGRLGQMATPWLGFGLVLPSGTDSNADWSLSYGGLLLEARVEPFPFDLALRVAAGVGGGSATRADERFATEDDPEFIFGSMYVAGLSYDWFPFYDPKSYGSGGLAFTFLVEGRFFPAGDVVTGGGFLGVEFTWWTGLDKRKLELPVEKAFE